jgi:predicted nucleic acid-binding protein
MIYLRLLRSRLLSYGMEWNERRAHIRLQQRYLDAILGSLPIIPYTEQTAYEHACIWAELETSGKMIGFYDLIVGATALERGSGVARFKKSHFARIRGLNVIEPK